MLWSEKTTVCRIFNCQRSVSKAQPSNLLTSAADRSHTTQTTSADVGARWSILSPPKLPSQCVFHTDPAPAEAGLIRSPKLFSKSLVRLCSFELRRDEHGFVVTLQIRRWPSHRPTQNFCSPCCRPLSPPRALTRGRAGLPTEARHDPASVGWWRIPGSNR